MARIRANLGCGATPTPGWRNFDNSVSIRLARLPLVVTLLNSLGWLDNNQLSYIAMARENDIRSADVAKKIPLPDASADVIYSSHMLEHLDSNRRMSFLREVLRVLAPGGLIRIVVPNVRLIAEDYLKSLDADGLVHALHMTATPAVGVRGLLSRIVAGSRRHQWQYDELSLCKLLRSAGFVDPTVLQPGETLIENPGELDLRARAEGSLYVEARKP